VTGHRLIIAEKPSVARDIARVLGIRKRGSGYLDGGDTRVTWCVGHLVQLAEPQKYDPAWRSWRLDSLPMLPDAFKLTTRREGNDQWQIVKKQLRESDLVEVVNACDAGREGELIFAWVYEMAKCRAPVRRLWISSMTDSAIKAGFDDLREGARYEDLQAAARCRSEADWLVGLNATRAMTTRLRSGPEGSLLSVGRVQTPTLSLLADREDEIEAFQVEDFWQIKARFDAAGGQWEALWTESGKGTDVDARGNRKRRDRLDDEAEAKAILARIQDKPGEVAKVTRRDKRERAPLLYDLTALQKECNRRFKYSAKKTLEIAQALYERHKLITYPRTDSRHLSADQVDGLPARIKGIQFGPYAEVANQTLERWPIKLSKRVVDDSEVTDHHAIVPTGVDARNCNLSPEEKWVFDLVTRRFLAVFQADAIFATATVETVIAQQEEQGGESVGPADERSGPVADHFIARGRTCVDPGWQAIDPPRATKKSKKGGKAGKKPADIILPPVEEGQRAEQVGANLHKGQTKPPRRYTEATLLAAMETAGQAIDDAELKRAMKRRGLGTPATRAAIIETLINRRYIVRDGNNLRPTDHGRAMLRALPVEALRSPRMTGEWEARLNAMAEGREQRDVFMTDVRRFTAELVDAVRNSDFPDAVRKALAPAAPDGAVLGTCPRCESEVRGSARGWRCTGCALYISAMVARRDISATLARSLLRDGRTKVIKGFKSRAGKDFAAALAFDADFQVVFRFPEPEPLGTCPVCRKPVTRRGRIFTCETGRDCRFVVFGEMWGANIEEKHVKALLVDGRSALIKGFETRQGERYEGRLELRDGRAVVVRSRPAEGAGDPP